MPEENGDTEWLMLTTQEEQAAPSDYRNFADTRHLP
jgi:hypothetical protein